MLAQNFAFILLCLGLGAVLRAFRVLPENAAQVLGAYVIWIAYPALVIEKLPALMLNAKAASELAVPFSMAWLHFLLAFAFVWALGKIFKWRHAAVGGLVLTAGLGNTSFVGFPLVEAFYGPEALPIAVVADQGSFFVVSTLGILAACFFAGQDLSAGKVLKRVFGFPPAAAFIAAVLLALAGVTAGPHVDVLHNLSVTLVPAALLSVGLQLNVQRSRLRRYAVPLACGLLLKLVVIPAVLAAFYVFAVGARGLNLQVTVLEAAMAPMITAAIIASEFSLERELVSLMVGLGIPLSLVTVWAWHAVLA